MHDNAVAQEFLPKLKRFMRKRSWKKEDAEDLAQDVWIHLLTYPAKADSQAAPGAIIWRSAHNVWCNSVKISHREKRKAELVAGLDLVCPGPNPEQALLGKWGGYAILKKIRGLKPSRRRALWLYLRHGNEDMGVISDQLGVTRLAAQNQVQNAKSNLLDPHYRYTGR